LSGILAYFIVDGTEVHSTRRGTGFGGIDRIIESCRERFACTLTTSFNSRPRRGLDLMTVAWVWQVTACIYMRCDNLFCRTKLVDRWCLTASKKKGVVGLCYDGYHVETRWCTFDGSGMLAGGAQQRCRCKWHAAGWLGCRYPKCSYKL